MGEWIAIIAGLFLLQAIMVVRQFASIRFPQLRWQAMPTARAPAAYADLFDQADAQLHALGFEALGWTSAVDGDAGTRTPVRMYRHPAGRAIAFVQPPVDPARPERLVVSFGNSLVDGSSLASFRDSPADAFFDTPRHRRRSVAGADIESLWRAHVEWRSSVPAADATAPIDTLDAAAATVSDGFSDVVDGLLANGTLRRDRDGSLRLRLHALPRLLRMLRSAPKAPADAAPLPLARERALLPLVERMRERAPTAGMQVLLIATTTLLFTLLGGLLWDWRYAVLLAGALLLHEGGHWLAMRLLGYRHVQMVLLPLLGGITTGVESDPRGSHRAIVSLMGPLPGIVLGWALLGWGLHGGPPGLVGAAAVLLVLNYLNLLPVPPLDGGYFLQSLLPHRWAVVEAVLVGLLVLGGIALALLLEWWLLLILVALQLFALRTGFGDARLAARVRREVDPATVPRHVLDDHLVAAVAGDQPQAKPAQRLARALRLRTLLLLKPPRAPARIALLVLYAAAFALPLAASPALRDFVRAGLASVRAPDAAVTARMDRELKKVRAQEAASATLDDAQLLAGIAAAAAEPGLFDDGTRVPSAVSAPPEPAAFAAAETRLGVALPAGYRELARAPQRDLLHMVPPERLERADAQYADWLDQWTDDGRQDTAVFASAPDGGHAPTPLSRAQLARTLVLAGGPDEGLLLHDANGDPCCRVLEFGDDEATGYPDLHAWLVAQHVRRTLEADTSRRMLAAQQRERVAAASLDLPALLDAANTSANAPEWPDVDATPPAPEAIAAAQRRVGALPDDYLATFAVRNGVPALGLLPIEEVVAIDAQGLERLLSDIEIVRIGDQGETQGVFMRADVVAPALVLGIWPQYRKRDDPAGHARTLLVRFADASPRYLDLTTRRAYSNLSGLLRERIAMERAMRAAFD